MEISLNRRQLLMSAGLLLTPEIAMAASAAPATAKPAMRTFKKPISDAAYGDLSTGVVMSSHDFGGTPPAEEIVTPGTYSYSHIDNALAVGMQLKVTF